MRLSDQQRSAGTAARLAVLFAVLLGLAGMANLDAAPLRQQERTIQQREELAHVLSVVEHRTTDPKVLEKMRKKLPGLNDRELHLAALLCERISRDDSSAGANIAFSIVTAMIVLR